MLEVGHRVHNGRVLLIDDIEMTVFNPAPSPVPAPTVLPEVRFVGNPCTAAFPDGKCTLCTGDCDSDSDCAGDLVCFQRSGGEDVPGCVWGSNSASLKADDDDFCK